MRSDETAGRIYVSQMGPRLVSKEGMVVEGSPVKRPP